MKRSRIMKSLFAAAAIAIACTFVSARPVEAKSKKVYRPDTMKKAHINPYTNMIKKEDFLLSRRLKTASSMQQTNTITKTKKANK